MSSEDEGDYMSDSFLEKCLPKDVRPGLTFSHSQEVSKTTQLKKMKQDEINKQRYRPYKVIEAERRRQGLNEAISEDNKGFALLQKMGYKPGLGIGKSKIGPSEPIPIKVKADRGGFGRDAALKEIAAMRSRLVLQRSQKVNAEDYRARIIKKATEKQVECDLRKSQRVCEQLDIEKGFTEPAEVWFWPKKEVPESLDEEGNQSTTTLEKEVETSLITECEDNSDFEPFELLEILTLYLRKTHLYCIWCGTIYNDDQDMSSECPGNTREMH